MSERLNVPEMRAKYERWQANNIGGGPWWDEVIELLDAIERTKTELETLSRWAGQQNDGNAFAEQVKHWANSHLERRLHARFDFGTPK